MIFPADDQDSLKIGWELGVSTSPGSALAWKLVRLAGCKGSHKGSHPSVKHKDGLFYSAAFQHAQACFTC